VLSRPGRPSGIQRSGPGSGAAAGTVKFGVVGTVSSRQVADKDPSVMNKITGAILMLAAAVSGHGIFVFLASHPEIHKYDVPPSVARMVLFGIATTTLLGLWGVFLLFRKDPQ
jgi:protein-S-isoprenylcysteine O-methyltransferase Ste14